MLPDHVNKLELISFQKIQKTLIKFYNDNQDEMFTYYDNRMSARFNMIKDDQEENNIMVDKVLDDLNIVNNYMDEDLKRKGIIQNQNDTICDPYYVRNFSFKKHSTKQMNFLVHAALHPSTKEINQHLNLPGGKGFFSGKWNPPMDSI